MNILVIGTVPEELGSKNFGGVAKVVWSLSKRLQNHSFNVSIGAIGQYYKGYKKVENINIHGIGFSLNAIMEVLKVLLTQIDKIPYYFPLQFLRLLYAIYFLSYINQKVQYEVLHVHHVFNQIPTAAKLMGIEAKILATVHSYSEVINCSNIDKRCQRTKDINNQLKNIDSLTHVSEQVKKQGVNLGIRWTCKDFVIYNGIEFPNSVFNSSEDNIDKKICFVGSLIPLKGIQVLLNSFEKIATNDVSITIAGRGELEQQIKEKVSKVGKINLEMVGVLEHRDALKMMARSSLLVVPSKSESFGLVYLEALSVKTPVIGFAPIIKEFKEQLTLNEEEKKMLWGYSHKRHTPDDLANKIDEMLKLKSKEESIDTLDSISSKVRRRFNWGEITEEYIKIYDQMAEK